MDLMVLRVVILTSILEDLHQFQQTEVDMVVVEAEVGQVILVDLVDLVVLELDGTIHDQVEHHL